MPTKKSGTTPPAPANKKTARNKSTKAKGAVQVEQVLTETEAENRFDGVERALLQTLRPQEVYLPQRVKRSVVTIDEVTNILHDIPITEQLEEAISSQKKTPLNRVSLSDDVLDSGILAKSITEVHIAALGAVLSQLDAGNTVFTAAMLYRAMTAKDAGVFVHRERQEMVDRIMDQLMYTPLKIDMKLYDKFGVDVDASLDGPILPAERIKVNISGQTCTAYQITKVPLIYRFARATKGLTLTPIEMLAVDMNYTNRNIVVLTLLHRRIAPYIYPTDGVYQKPAPLDISYADIYDAAEEVAEKESTNQAVFRRRIRATIAGILDTWVERRYIESWEDIREGRAYIGCRIHFTQDAPPTLPEYHNISIA